MIRKLILLAVATGIGWATMTLATAQDPSQSNSGRKLKPVPSQPVSMGAVTPIPHAPGALMRQKLEGSQHVLEGLLRRDFDAIARGAREMKRISEAAEWPRARDEVYEHFSQTFRRQCNQLESLATERNHEGVTFTYLGMTNTCVQCHDYVRDSRKVAGPKEGDVRLIPSHWPERVSGR